MRCLNLNLNNFFILIFHMKLCFLGTFNWTDRTNLGSQLGCCTTFWFYEKRSSGRWFLSMIIFTIILWIGVTLYCFMNKRRVPEIEIRLGNPGPWRICVWDTFLLSHLSPNKGNAIFLTLWFVMIRNIVLLLSFNIVYCLYNYSNILIVS